MPFVWNFQCPSSSHWTSLHFAARHGHLTVVTELLKRGLNLNDQTKEGVFHHLITLR
jgi:ankyrin repeat protein